MPKAGELIVLTDGDYSDYGINGHFTVLTDFSLKETREAYVENLPIIPVLKYVDRVPDSSRTFGYRLVKLDPPVDTGATRKAYSTIDGYIAYLIEHRFIEELAVTEVHYDVIGTAYSNID